MALRVYRIVITSSPKSIYAEAGDKEKGISLPAAGKSSLCSRFVHPKRRPDEHTSTLTEREWKDNPVYNGDHFIYWGATTKRLKDGTKARFQIVEQTEFLQAASRTWQPHEADEEYLKRATATHFISRGKVAYRCELDEAYAIPSSLRPGGFRKSTQLFPNQEFSEGNGVSGFICLFDPTLKGENIKRQVDYLEKLLRELHKTKRPVLLACTKCDLADDGKIQLGEHLASSVAKLMKKPLPFIQTSAMEDINVEEAFRFIAESRKRRGTFRRSARFSFRPFMTMMKERGVDNQYALATCKRIIQEKVNSFKTEWTQAKVELETDPKFYEALQVAGEQSVKLSFCQRLMEVKVMEMKEIYGTRGRSDSRNYQSELLGAFKKHPDLGSEDLYDYIRAPSFSSPNTPSLSSSRNSFDNASINFPSRSETHTSFPDIGSPLSSTYPPPSPFSSPLPAHPPTPPPTTSIPTKFDTFSVGSACAPSPLHMIQLNRSTEFLATLPRTNLSRNTSFKTRTLPPLPTSVSFSSRHSQNSSLTASQPQLDEDFSDGTFEQRRRLSSSLDCLQVIDLVDSVPLNGGESMSNLDKLQAEPYLRPVEIRQVVENQDTHMPRSSRLISLTSTYAGRSRSRPPIPESFHKVPKSSFGRSKSFKEQRVRPPRLSNGSTVSQPVSGHEVSKATPRTFSSPIPPERSIVHSNGSPILSSHFSVDSFTMETIDGLHIITDSLSVGQDNDSITSGPFAQIEDLPTENSSSHADQSMLQAAATLDTSPGQRPPVHVRDSDDEDDDGFNLYAKIGQNDDTYLVMESAGAASVSPRAIQEDVGSTTPVKTRSSVQSIIKKLQQVTAVDQDKTSTVPYIPTTSPQLLSRKLWRQSKNKRSADSILLSSNGEDLFLRSPYSASPSHPSPAQSNKNRQSLQGDRPLPPSPTKVIKKSMTMSDSRQPVRKKVSTGGGNNIYESIDENEEWLQHLRKKRTSQIHTVNLVMGKELVSKCEQVVQHFFAKPAVQQLWIESVKATFSKYKPPSGTSFVPPFTINPEHFKDLIQRKVSIESIQTSAQPIELAGEEQEDTGVAVEPLPHAEEQATMSQSDSDQRMRELSGKLSLTNSVLEMLNQHLLTNRTVESSSSSETEDEEEEEEEDEEEEEEENDSEERESDLETEGSTVADSEDESDSFQKSGSGRSRARRAGSLLVHQQKPLVNNSPIIELDLPQTHSWSSFTTSTSPTQPTVLPSSHSTEIDQSLPIQPFHSSHNLINQIDSFDQNKDLKQPAGIHDSLHHQLQTGSHSFTRNGHLAIAAVNSLDSGISANGNYGTEEVS